MNTKTNKKKFHLLEDNNNSHVPSGNITFIISFIIPVIIFITLYYIKEIFPFGDNCYLRSDMYHQYAPFYSELWNKLRHGEGLPIHGILEWELISHHFLHIILQVRLTGLLYCSHKNI